MRIPLELQRKIKRCINLHYTEKLIDYIGKEQEQQDKIINEMNTIKREITIFLEKDNNYKTYGD